LQEENERVSRVRFVLPVSPQDEDWTTRSYPDFGVYVFKRRDVLLTVRCGPEENISDGGHEHDDQGSVTLAVGDRVLIRDPGTFVYTADAAWRHRFRSHEVHLVPMRASREVNASRGGAFGPIERDPARVHVWTKRGMAFEVDSPAGPVYRVIELLEEALTITDFTEAGDGPAPLRERIRQLQDQPWSAGYGRLETP
jgi:hypothetical protein